MMIPEAWENHESMAPAEAGLLPLPRLAHGAVGRPGVDRLHRRHGHRRGARPQRPAPVPLLGHRRRPRDHGVGGRRARRRPGQGRAEGPAAAGPHVPRRHGRGPHRRRRRDQGSAWPPSTPTSSGSTSTWSTSTTSRPGPTSCARTRPVVQRQQVFGYTTEELKILIEPMARTGAEPLGSMGTDTPDRRAVVAAAAAVRLLHPALRPGHQPAARRHPRGAGHLPRRHDRARGQPARPEPASCRQIHLARPDHRQRRAGQARRTSTPTTTWPTSARHRPAVPLPGRRGWRRPARRARRAAPRGQPRPSTSGANILILSDRNCQRRDWPRSRRCCSPSAVHHHLIREKTRTRVGLVVETGDAREVHHMALLIGYGAAAINPYLAFETIEDLIAEGLTEVTDPGQGGRATTSRPAARACSRSCRRWASRRWRPTPAPRSSRPSACPRTWSTSSSPAPSAASAASASTSSPRRSAERHLLAYPDRPERAGPPPARGRRRVPVAPRGRVPPVQPGHRLQAAARHPHEALRDLQGVHAARSTTRAASWPRCAACSGSARASARRCRSTRSSRSARSSSGSPPARCPTARSRPRPTRPWPSP